MADADIQRVLDFWFADEALDSPRIDSRMDRWFGNSADFDAEVGARFGDLIRRASNGELSDWARRADGRLALIILIDQFRRNIYRGTAEAFARDELAVELCLEGEAQGCRNELTPLQNLFFYMPLQHAESIELQRMSVDRFRVLADEATDTMRETFLTSAQFAELHHDIVAEFGRFPHRNRVLGRPDTEAETEYLAGDNQSFGQ